MATFIQNFRQRWDERGKREQQVLQSLNAQRPDRELPAPVEIGPDDPLVAYFLKAPGAVDIASLHLDSPALQGLKAAGVQMAIPLVSQDELVGLLNLGPRRSEQDYSADDRGLLNTLATQAAPAVRVAQLVREQQAQVRTRERLGQELHVARLIQKTLLPRELPALAGWKLSTYYQPAREVGGDFYDFLSFEDGRLGIVIGDVTDKGVPAALIMASTRSILRAAAQRLISPGSVLERVNDSLCPDIPPNMFVTCLYAILDPSSGRLWYANAGHDLPYRRHHGQVAELRATGMPLGLMPGMHYEEKETLLLPGESILLYSDGIVEAHNAAREMFGIPRLIALLEEHVDGMALNEFLLKQLHTFTGPEWEQEDDVTLVVLQRAEENGGSEIVTDQDETTGSDPWHVLGTWIVPSKPGNERLAMEYVAQAVQPFELSTKRLEALKTAVAEATMNAMEHGNRYDADKPVSIQVSASQTALAVRITDQGGGQAIPAEAAAPDLEAKLAELQSPRGWGLFLIKNLVDEMHMMKDETHHTIELIVYLEGVSHASKES